MKLILVLTAAAAAAAMLAAPSTAARPHWSTLTPTQKLHVVDRVIRRERPPVRWWVHHRARLPASSAGPLLYCRAIGVAAPGAICLHGQRLVAALHVRYRIAADLAAAAAARERAALGDGAEFACIHRGEGAWNAVDSTGTYYGGLQMDLGFQRTYGPEFLARWGTADHWPVWAQVTAARRARDGYAGYRPRGYGPWPHTAAVCGQL